MASNKLLPFYILFCILCLSFISQAAGRVGRQRNRWRPHKAHRERRHLLRGPFFPCFRRDNCGAPITLDETMVFELEGRTDATFLVSIGENKTALNFAFEAEHDSVRAYIVLLKAFPSRQDGIKMSSPDDKATTWKVAIPGETIRDYNDETIIIRIDNRHPFKSVVKLTIGFEPAGPPVLLIALSVTGGVVGLIIVAIAITCYLRKRRRRLIQVGFPILTGSQPQLSSVHAPSALNRIDATQQHLIQQQLVLQQQLLLLQQQHIQLRESQQFSPSNNPLSPSTAHNQQHQPQERERELERDPGQQQQDVTVENFDTRFPEVFYEYIDSPLSQTICSICLEEMKTRTICRQLDCNHVFHSECIKLWLVNKIGKSRTVCCPNCNRDVCEAPPDTAVTKNNELHDSHVVLMIQDNAFD